jgi:hypothetical protein
MYRSNRIGPCRRISSAIAANGVLDARGPIERQGTCEDVGA